MYPSLTGNILDSEGTLLFQLRNNVIKLNPGHCSKIFGDSLGYEIHDSAGQLIFKVDTVFVHLPQIGEETFVTTIKANFYNKTGELVFKANSGEPNEKILVSTKNVFGYSNGSMGVVSGMKEEEIEFLRFIFSTGNAAVEPKIGIIDGEEFDLNGKVLIDATVKNCTVSISGGDFTFIGPTSLENNKYVLTGSAKNLTEFLNLFVPKDAPKKFSDRVKRTQ